MVHDMRSGEGDLTWTALAAASSRRRWWRAVIRWMLDYLRRRTYACSPGTASRRRSGVVLWLSGKR